MRQASTHQPPLASPAPAGPISKTLAARDRGANVAVVGGVDAAPHRPLRVLFLSLGGRQEACSRTRIYALLPFLPNQLTIAGLGLRVGAYVLDTIPFWISGNILVLSTRKSIREVQISVPVYLALVLPKIANFDHQMAPTLALKGTP